MLLRWLRGLLGGRQISEQLTPEAKRTLQHPEPAARPEQYPILTTIPAPAPAATVRERRVAPPVDPLALWNSQRSMRSQLVDEFAPGVPDARALVELLESGPDELIRQLPVSAREALVMCDDPKLPRSRLVSQLARDPSLMQAMLRTANSATFSSGREPVLGMEAALDRIGVGNARAVLTASCASSLLSLPGGQYNAMAAQVWSHMIRTGPIAQCLAPAFSVNPDEAMTLALLHDIGKLIVFDRLSVLRAARRRSIELPPAFLEALLSVAHEPLGALAAQRWELGPRAVAAIGNHHRQVDALNHEPLSEVLYLADLVGHALACNDMLNLDDVWAKGALSAPRPRIEAILQRWATVPA
jgi:HD-like signal output (HDOD) protein